MKERKRRQSLGGAVLIMVLTVMFILMVLLMAAMTTVSTANQRIFTKFEENQAYYTARSALDVFTQNMIADRKYVAYNDGGNKIEYKYGDESKTAYMKQGLGLQIDVYSITAQNGMNIQQSYLATAAGNISVAADKKNEYNYYFGADPTINEIYYEVELPKTADASKAYGMLSDRVSGVSKAKIKIEVLKRKYDMGAYDFTSGSHNGTDVKTYLETLSDDDLTAFFSNDSSVPSNKKMTVGEAKDVAEAIIKGNRKKDTMQIKITATTTYRGVEGTAVLIIDSNEPPANNSSRAITAFGGTGSDNMSILGGMAAENTINWGSNDGYIYGSVYVEDDFLMTSNGPKIHLNSGETLVVGGDVQIENNHFQVTNETSTLVVDDKNAPFVYIGGELRTGGGLNGSPFMNMDVVAEKINIGASAVSFDSSSTMYCKELKINAPDSSYNGDIYVDGDVIISSTTNSTKVTYGGDGSPTVVHGGTGTIHFTGKVIDGNTGADVTSGAGTGFVKETTSFWSNIPEPNKIANNNPTATAGDDGTKIEFQLPGRTQKKQIETHTKNFDTYYVKDSDGNRVMITVTDPVSGASINKPQVKSAQVMADINTMGDKTQPFTSASTGITENLSSKASAGGSFYGETFNYVLDTSGTDVSCKWNFDNKKIYIKGGGTVTLLLSNTGWGSSNISYSNDNLILVDDDTTLKIVGDATSGDIKFDKLKVYNQTTWGAYRGIDAGEGIDSLKVGSKSGIGIKVPKIFYYFTGSNNFKVNNDCLLTGYIYAPDAKIDFPTAGNGLPSAGLQYNGTSVTDPNTKVCVIGSALVKGADIKNMQGVAYINPDLDDDTPGEPIHQWQSFQYIRG